MLKLLIDENLSPTLASIAHHRGYECTHVSHLGLSGRKDWELKSIILEGDWTFLTANSVDFRGPAGAPGTAGEYADVSLHAGLVCINANAAMNRELQRAVFGSVLDELDKVGDLTNVVLEVEVRATSVKFRRYQLPQEADQKEATK